MKLASAVAMVALVSSLFLGGGALQEVQASDDDRMSHYKGEPSPSLEVAVKNLTEFNQQLEAILASDDLDIHKLSEIHQLTYTLENALERIEDELDRAEDLLEEVHVGSERAQYEQVREAGKAYLEQIRKLLPQTQQ
ncbi:hypothetical protein CWE15_08735 [Aliidiomarina taiwanensis]|uniref:Uncharacterized protein n=1 Tax=Aliidiomarina taiwanensis TaxID=946228 RepID=A0A432X0Y3_9GAMM|nr:DUF6746 family protein [Aliidiomarina taiwanensis]RUO39830.1 hypothetical protein CWE15_08735 [Aliidiomarina taiwanensis]